MAGNNDITQEKILEALGKVMDPELGRDLVSLNMIRNVQIDNSKVSFDLVLTTMACPLKGKLEDDARAAVAAIPGVTEVSISTGAQVPAARKLPEQAPIPGVKNTIAVASGKGGVGKSTVAVNLAVALAKSGAAVGLLDADLYGPSLPLMLGINEGVRTTPDKKMVPPEKFGLKLISVGFMLKEEAPLIWRGPLVMRLTKQFLTEVEWGELDYLVIDLPPGTGDVQLTLVQTIPLTGVVVVTTPQDVALIDAQRAIKMFEKVDVPVLGIVENMSYFICPHCEGRSDIFSHGGGERTSERYGVPLLGQIPLKPEIREGGDTGLPVVESSPESEAALEFNKIAGAVASCISVMNLTGGGKQG